jgi:hypothetical protein
MKRAGNNLRGMAAFQRELAVKEQNAAKKTEMLNRANHFNTAAKEANNAAEKRKANYASSLTMYEKKLRAKLTAHASRTGMGKVKESELVKMEKECIAGLGAVTPPGKTELSLIGQRVRAELKRENRLNSSGGTRRLKRKNRRTLKR